MIRLFKLVYHLDKSSKALNAFGVRSHPDNASALKVKFSRRGIKTCVEINSPLFKDRSTFETVVFLLRPSNNAWGLVNLFPLKMTVVRAGN